MRFAVSAGARPPEPESLRTLVTEAERLGFDTVWFSDLGTLPSTDPLLSVAMAAAWTDRLKLGITVVPFGYEPYVFARQLAQLDRLSAGRLRVMLVPGLDQPGERRALGIEGADRGRLLDELVPTLRLLWAGSPRSSETPGAAVVPPLGTTPVQDPMQIWLAGKGPRALARAGRLADGWRGGATSPEEAREIIDRIQQAAAAAGRAIDPGHFGMTIAYARDEHDVHGGPLAERPAATGRDELRNLVAQLVSVGMSKFSVRRISPVTSWPDELAWLADAILDLETSLSSSDSPSASAPA